jgi:hypothetical protein
MQDCYVFLGPSLSLKRAQAILPQARFLPPVRCGDILQLVRLQPKMIVIIDGCFEECASVWHKEIMHALSSGVIVVGAASMGALRAAELDQFGMIGVGEIYQRYARGELENDDAVALLHHENNGQYQSVTHALVDIEATLQCALSERVIDEKTAQALFLQAKDTFYHQRHFDQVCAEHAALRAWYQQNGLLSQKAADAACALRAAPTFSSVKSISYNQTIPVKSLYCMQSAQPFFCYRDWLPDAEKIALYARLLDDDYMVVKRLARLMVLTNTRLDSPMIVRMQQQSMDKIPEAILRDIHYFLILADQTDVTHYRVEHPLQFRALFYSVMLYRHVLENVGQRGLRLTDEDLKQKVMLFRHFHRLTEEAALHQFLLAKGLDEAGFIGLVSSIATFEYFVRSNNYLLINENFVIDNHCYLIDALHLTGFYDKAHALMNDSAQQARLINEKFEKQGEPYLYGLSFQRGLKEFMEFAK